MLLNSSAWLWADDSSGAAMPDKGGVRRKEDDLEMLQTQLDKANAEVAQLRQRLSASDAELMILRAELAEARAKIHALTTIERSIKQRDDEMVMP